MSTEKEDTKVGFELLDDECLAAIVNGDVSEYGALKNPEACAAFAELARRSGIRGY